MPYFYSVYGLDVSSEIELPLPPAQSTQTDLSIEFGRTPTQLSNPTHSGLCYQVQASEFLLQINHVARFWATNGTKITIEPVRQPNVNQHYSLYLLGSVLGAILHQRNTSVLHGSVVEKNGRAYAFIGESGSGKSTAAACLQTHGFRLLSDDLCVISLTSPDTPLVHPGYPRQKLWNDSLKNLGVPKSRQLRIRPEIEKKYVDASPRFCNSNTPLQRIYLLSRTTGPELLFKDLSAVERIESLRRHTYRKRFMATNEAHARAFAANATLANSVSMKRIERETDDFDLKNFSQRLIANIEI